MMYMVYGDPIEPTCIELPEAVHNLQVARAAMCKALDLNGYVIIAKDEERAIVTYQFIRRAVSASRHNSEEG